MIGPGPSFLGLKYINLSDDTEVASGGGTDIQTITPPEGFVYQILSLGLNTPAIGGATGTHKTVIKQDYVDSAGFAEILEIRGADGAQYYINHKGFVGSTEYPAGAAQQFDIVKKGLMWANNANPLEITYTNDSDANQAGNRTLTFLVKVYKEVL